MDKIQYDLKSIIKNFQVHGRFLRVQPYGSGHINDTFVSEFDQYGIIFRYIHQRLNTCIFKEPEKVMENIERVTGYIHSKLKKRNCPDISRHVLTLVNSIDNKLYYTDSEENVWRTYLFIEGAKTHDIIESENHAENCARLFGKFQKELIDLPEPRLNTVIPDFHNSIIRFNEFQAAVSEDKLNRAKDIKEEIDFINKNEESCKILVELLEKGDLPERITHNDTKLNNVMIDIKTGEAICIIDLDTLMPGLVHYDFGDMIRTYTSPAAEDEKDVSKVTMQMNIFKSIAKGYLSSIGEYLTPMEKEYLAVSGKIITLTIGIRFLTDYLQGDTYFRTSRPNHNLDRCRTQIALVKSIDKQIDKMNKFIEIF